MDSLEKPTAPEMEIPEQPYGNEIPRLADVVAHFGYAEFSGFGSCWRNAPEVFSNLTKLPEVIRLSSAHKGRLRVVFDFDPAYPVALIQLFTEELEQ